MASKLRFRDKSQQCAQNGSKSFQTCGAVQILLKSHEMIMSLFMAGAVLCAGFEVWKCDFRGKHRES